MKATTVILSAICVLLAVQSTSADCAPYQTMTLDTLQPGVVEVTVCTVAGPAVCTTDTVTEQQLVDSLVARYLRTPVVALGRIDSVFGWGDWILAESARVVYDAEIKGTVPAGGEWLNNVMWEDVRSYNLSKGKEFLLFINRADTTKRIIEPGYCDLPGFGYVVDNGGIVNIGYGAFAGVSVPFTMFLNAVLDTYTIANNSIMCFAAPCPNFTVTAVGTHASRNVDAVRDTGGAYLGSGAAVIGRQARVRGYFVRDSLAGWTHAGTTFVITEILSPAGVKNEPASRIRTGSIGSLTARAAICYDVSGRRVSTAGSAAAHRAGSVRIYVDQAGTAAAVRVLMLGR
jgi:hypothetical protein